MDLAGTTVDYWHWWILGVALIILEVLVPGTFFLWMGISAGVVGALLLLLPDLDWEYQVLAFAVLSLGAIAVSRAYLRRHPIVSDRPTLNRRGEQYVGRTFTLSDPIVNGRGTIRVDDTTWRVEGPDCVAGERVKVTDCDGTLLRVQASDG